MVTELLTKYIWLVQTFVRAADRGLDLDGICSKWENRFGTPYSRRTFNNHREAIAEVFGIEIICDRSRNIYKIASREDISDKDAAAAWLIDTFTVNSVLSLGKERLSGRVSVEEIPSGHKHLTGIMDAMLDGNKLRVTYLKYGSSAPETFTLSPYALKEAVRRWYLIAWCEERGAMRVYGLDRITRIETLEARFRMPEDFDVDRLFADSYGVYLPEGQADEIVIRTSPKEAAYLADLPLHPSQKVVSDTPEGVVVSMKVRPDDSLIMDLVRLGSRIEVISPPEIREKVINEIKKMNDIYKI
ncbi:MAG: helix-turn-helix transcriptional regulator [Candidatus Cryptobacteroides sp.]